MPFKDDKPKDAWVLRLKMCGVSVVSAPCTASGNPAVQFVHSASFFPIPRNVKKLRPKNNVGYK